ncbi:HAD family hydrolase [Paenibacillus polysaccharolyticus]|uniref:HAD family hydrolase n=1 Tax=Paenibacillus polysaccharolyticus TaxID=582692 RepID=UPI0012B91B38|nr:MULTISPECIES: HAD family hydrolase [Paenibacillus]MCP1133521.1 HAD family hydrolase [Paenibacillus polysaccharolyticus]
MEFPVIIVDLDGTLLKANKEVSERNVKAIQDCAHRGMKFIFATARPPRAVKAFLPEKLLELGSFVYYNGAYTNCRHTGKQNHIGITPALTAEVLDYCLACNPNLDISLEVRDVWMSLKPYDAETIMKVKGQPMVRSLMELKQQEASKILFTGNLDRVAFQECFEGKLNILITDQGELTQVSALNASKEHAVSVICDAMGVAMQDVMVFGDDVNDIGLFDQCGWPVAMGNATQDLKCRAKEITETNENDGVAVILERLCQ